MATYTLISSNVLASSAASVTFSAIPATYTDLVVRTSIRSDRASTWDQVYIQFNSDTANNYSNTYLSGLGSGGANSSNNFDYSGLVDRFVDGDTATSNTFSNGELYIPSYTASQNKPMSEFAVQETNATDARMAANANLWRNTAAITSIRFSPQNGTNWLAGSSFYLYGISNA
jgi:hypothetical protein